MFKTPLFLIFFVLTVLCFSTPNESSDPIQNLVKTSIVMVNETRPFFGTTNQVFVTTIVSKHYPGKIHSTFTEPITKEAISKKIDGIISEYH